MDRHLAEEYIGKRVKLKPSGGVVFIEKVVRNSALCRFPGDQRATRWFNLSKLSPSATLDEFHHVKVNGHEMTGEQVAELVARDYGLHPAVNMAVDTTIDPTYRPIVKVEAKAPESLAAAVPANAKDGEADGDLDPSKRYVIASPSQRCVWSTSQDLTTDLNHARSMDPASARRVCTRLRESSRFIPGDLQVMPLLDALDVWTRPGEPSPATTPVASDPAKTDPIPSPIQKTPETKAKAVPGGLGDVLSELVTAAQAIKNAEADCKAADEAVEQARRRRDAADKALADARENARKIRDRLNGELGV